MFILETVVSKTVTYKKTFKINTCKIIWNSFSFLKTTYCLFISITSIHYGHLSTKLRCFAPSVINNELHHTTTDSNIRDNPRPVSSLLGTHQAGIVVRHCCWGLTYKIYNLKLIGKFMSSPHVVSISYFCNINVTAILVNFIYISLDLDCT